MNSRHEQEIDELDINLIACKSLKRMINIFTEQIKQTKPDQQDVPVSVGAPQFSYFFETEWAWDT